MTPSSARDAADALRAGRLILLPTETVYGLGADAGDAQAVAAVFEAKGRPRFNPLISHVADAVAAERIAVMDDRARALAEAFWPGPLTLVMPVRDRERVCDLARAGLDSVAVRVPGHARAREILALFDRPVVAPSANRSGRPSPTTFADAVEETGFAVAAAVDGGDCAVGVESTVASVLDGRVSLLRPGSVTREEIEAVVGALSDDGQGHRSPGRLSVHYAPDAPVRINAVEAQTGEILLGFGPVQGDPRFVLSRGDDLREAAANLFRRFREADRERPTGIAVAPIPATGLGEAINDRLKRAAGFVG
ncbi:threonylcarbamoyl-AMP synthase [Brevundimonas sp. S30B]|uniref:L-threonylcarbamoyladenylate synthase n=1 Tax=unclassified Brevundimonas TaxID=2622653 RepID=UPI001072E815|nr:MULTISPECIES: L-threonylcarbamoyladenylate synthase [unclassified Brevundimonas]QBX37389.1 threonylcarbamoyl-AMP synthase [Brevundimonas sp. MF30-B]TFW03818.1 threonylcarbamoyl-AMP synthase [Brevundimonas sp. S30B]